MYGEYGGEDAHLEAAYEDRFGFPGDECDPEYGHADPEPDEWFECPVHGEVPVTGYDEPVPSMAGYGYDSATHLACGGIVRDGPYSDGSVHHPREAGGDGLDHRHPFCNACGQEHARGDCDLDPENLAAEHERLSEQAWDDKR